MLIGIILILLGVYFIVKMLCPGFDIDINWNIIWPVILMVLGIEGIIRSKKLDLFNVILTLIGVIYLLSGLKIIGNINGRFIFAIILIGAGISFILSSLGKKKVKKISKDKIINYFKANNGVSTTDAFISFFKTDPQAVKYESTVKHILRRVSILNKRTHTWHLIHRFK